MYARRHNHITAPAAHVETSANLVRRISDDGFSVGPAEVKLCAALRARGESLFPCSVLLNQRAKGIFSALSVNIENEDSGLRTGIQSPIAIHVLFCPSGNHFGVAARSSRPVRKQWNLGPFCAREEDRKSVV